MEDIVVGMDVRDAKKIAVMVFENMMKGFFWIGEYAVADECSMIIYGMSDGQWQSSVGTSTDEPVSNRT